jgi:hypothetical protein
MEMKTMMMVIAENTEPEFALPVPAEARAPAVHEVQLQNSRPTERKRLVIAARVPSDKTLDDLEVGVEVGVESVPLVGTEVPPALQVLFNTPAVTARIITSTEHEVIAEAAAMSMMISIMFAVFYEMCPLKRV